MTGAAVVGDPAGVSGLALRIKLQIFCGDEIAMGPGKADLLDSIDLHGSISAAARAMDMSYRRAWLLVDVMNRCWAAPLVETRAGGVARGGGARLTDEGRRVLALYRALRADVDAARLGDTWGALQAVLLETPRAHQAG